MSKLAVVLPLFNHAAYIAAALDSVYSQTLPATRVIVIDDGSTDDSLAIAKSVARRGTEVIHQKNCGAHATLNRGIQMASDSEFLAVLNSDDLWHPSRLERCLTALAEPGCDVVCTGLHLIGPNGESLPADSPKVRRHHKIWALLGRDNDPLLSLAISNFAKTTSNLVSRRKFLLEHPFADYRYVHDYQFFLLAALKDRLVVLSEDLLGYRVHDTNTIKADGRRPVVQETVQMHFNLLGSLASDSSESPWLRRRIRLYLQRVLGNHTDFRGEIFLQVMAHALAKQPELFEVQRLTDLAEFETKSESLPQ